MKVSREKSAANREAVLEHAGALFREHGFDGVGVADIMQAAGLTHGGFYRQFGSKEDLALEASQKVMARSASNWRKVAEEDPDNALRNLIERYLRNENVSDPSQSCIFATLGGDASRQSPAVRAAFTEGLEALIATLAIAMPSKGRDRRRQEALAAFAAMVGALVLARAVDRPELSAELVEAAKTRLLPKG